MNTDKLEFEEKNDLNPVCPHCQVELKTIYYRSKGLGFIEGKNIVYLCSSCRKVLGFGQSRMI